MYIMTLKTEFTHYQRPSEMHCFDGKIVAFKEVPSDVKIEEIVHHQFALVETMMEGWNLMKGVNMEVLYSNKSSGKQYMHSVQNYLRSYKDETPFFNEKGGWNRLYIREATKEELEILSEQANRDEVVLPFQGLSDRMTLKDHINNNLPRKEYTINNKIGSQNIIGTLSLYP